jgi:hypothetical protein
MGEFGDGVIVGAGIVFFGLAFGAALALIALYHRDKAD